MILLEPTNKILTELLQSKFESPQDRIQTTLADYDGVTYTVSTPQQQQSQQQEQQQRSVLRIAMRMKCFQSELAKYGAIELLQKEYGSYLVSSNDGNEVVLEIDVESVPVDAREELIRKVSLLKTNAMSAVFEKAFNDQLKGSNVASGAAAASNNDLMVVHYREEESIFVKASADRVTVIFSTVFKDETDGIFGKVFLQEFVDCRKQTSLQNAPQVLYTNKEAPMELRGRKDLREGENIGYVTFVLFPRHYEKPQQRTATVQLVQYFRDYLHYHIKCSKAYMHCRMRAKVESWLKVLNRAKPEFDAKDKEKKTASGKTFTRK